MNAKLPSTFENIDCSNANDLSNHITALLQQKKDIAAYDLNGWKDCFPCNTISQVVHPTASIDYIRKHANKPEMKTLRKMMREMETPVLITHGKSNIDYINVPNYVKYFLPKAAGPIGQIIQQNNGYAIELDEQSTMCMRQSVIPITTCADPRETFDYNQNLSSLAKLLEWSHEVMRFNKLASSGGLLDLNAMTFNHGKYDTSKNATLHVDELVKNGTIPSDIITYKGPKKFVKIEDFVVYALKHLRGPIPKAVKNAQYTLGGLTMVGSSMPGEVSSRNAEHVASASEEIRQANQEILTAVEEHAEVTQAVPEDIAPTRTVILESSQANAMQAQLDTETKQRLRDERHRQKQERLASKLELEKEKVKKARWESLGEKRRETMKKDEIYSKEKMKRANELAKREMKELAHAQEIMILEKKRQLEARSEHEKQQAAIRLEQEKRETEKERQALAIRLEQEKQRAALELEKEKRESALQLERERQQKSATTSRSSRKRPSAPPPPPPQRVVDPEHARRRQIEREKRKALEAKRREEAMRREAEYEESMTQAELHGPHYPIVLPKPFINPNARKRPLLHLL